jgi:hypothetical protein
MNAIRIFRTFIMSIRSRNATGNLFAVVLFCTLLFAASCKKCYTCYNTCYHCATQNAYRDICNTDYSAPTEFADARLNYANGGFVCTQIQSTQSFKYCDDKATAGNVRAAYERLSYSCD